MDAQANVEFTLDGRVVHCPDGMTVAGALLHLGQQPLRITSRHQEPRALFCGMGVCFECLMCIDGRSGVRACVTRVEKGMQVETQIGESKLEGGA